MTIRETIVVSERHSGGQAFCVCLMRYISWFVHEVFMYYKWEYTRNVGWSGLSSTSLSAFIYVFIGPHHTFLLISNLHARIKTFPPWSCCTGSTPNLMKLKSVNSCLKNPSDKLSLDSCKHQKLLLIISNHCRYCRYLLRNVFLGDRVIESGVHL